MAKLLKDFLDNDFYNYLSELLALEINNFDKEMFKSNIFSDQWSSLELKQRMRHTSITVNNYIKEDYTHKLKVILNITNRIIKDKKDYNILVYMFIPDFVEVYGINHYDLSVKAIEKISQLVSCEFTVRRFIIKYKDKMMSQMLNWSLSKSTDLRRLSSEGCRPRLPWAVVLEEFKIDPSPIIPILENLKHDSSEYVRRSVANNLNDISKDNEKLVLEICEKWIGIDSDTDKLVKHACRSLLKNGNSIALSMFGYCNIKLLDISHFNLLSHRVDIGSNLILNFKIKNLVPKDVKLRLEYAIYHKKANNSLSKKVFKISEFVLEANTKREVKKTHKFIKISTRRYYPGNHKVSIIINGIESDTLNFTLV